MLHFAQLLETLVAAGQKTYLTSQVHIEATLESNRDLEAQNRKLEADERPAQGAWTGSSRASWPR